MLGNEGTSHLLKIQFVVFGPAFSVSWYTFFAGRRATFWYFTPAIFRRVAHLFGILHKCLWVRTPRSRNSPNTSMSKTTQITSAHHVLYWILCGVFVSEMLGHTQKQSIQSQQTTTSLLFCVTLHQKLRHYNLLKHGANIPHSSCVANFLRLSQKTHCLVNSQNCRLNHHALSIIKNHNHDFILTASSDHHSSVNSQH